jgi:hypothetical protein
MIEDFTNYFEVTFPNGFKAQRLKSIIGRDNMMIDFLGNKITIGATVVYPGRQGSTMWMNRGLVVCLNSYYPRTGDSFRDDSITIRRDNGKEYDIYRLDRVVVVPDGSQVAYRLEENATITSIPVMTRWHRIKRFFTKPMGKKYYDRDGTIMEDSAGRRGI